MTLSNNLNYYQNQNINSSKYQNKAEQLSGRTKSAQSSGNQNKLKEVSQEFESLFINMVFKEMRKTVPQSEWLHGGMKQEIFEDMLYEEYSKQISTQGGIGLSELIYRSLSGKSG